MLKIVTSVENFLKIDFKYEKKIDKIYRNSVKKLYKKNRGHPDIFRPQHDCGWCGGGGCGHCSWKMTSWHLHTLSQLWLVLEKVNVDISDEKLKYYIDCRIEEKNWKGISRYILSNYTVYNKLINFSINLICSLINVICWSRYIFYAYFKNKSSLDN